MAFSRVLTFLEMVKFEHTVFALPFAFVGALLTERHLPAWSDVLWITVAMVGARTAAMSLNRLIDRHVDARNPRTANRALPKGLLSVGEVWIYVIISFALLLIAAYQLSPLAVRLFPLVVAILVGYSYTKRFTWACHLWLGAALGFAPLGAWIAIANRIDLAPILLALGVLFWVAGFDIIYACLDHDFDIRAGIHSIPVRFGIPIALRIARGFHVVAPALFLAAGMALHLGVFYFLGVALAIALLAYEHAIVNPGDLSRVNVAFFHANAVLSILIFCFTLVDVLR
ncbi:MAG: UbiA-like polyprenyltransferase [Thermoanaerobacterales bacterium]|nr:UbiA-like polyprenyltransferase [Bacillota bacterium]MDI6907189.1 UbiA-like polyprenyltransferase [Thermoanaerobacterales bacterium]